MTQIINFFNIKLKLVEKSIFLTTNIDIGLTLLLNGTRVVNVLSNHSNTLKSRQWHKSYISSSTLIKLLELFLL